ncbi:hypothetical protein JCM8097_007333 [Rhodosporidiobolus ruineniae]
MATQQDLWLKGAYPIGPFQTPPINQAVADVLANAPWSAFRGTGRVAFTYELVDRPEAGTALLALHHPPTRPTPNDGLRYLYEGNEMRTTSQHTVQVPSSTQTPNQSTRITVELECFTALCGHFPPLPGQQLPPDSPELRLTRYRKRWHLVNGQFPNLYFYYWGRDDNGGLGPGQPAQPAQPGWDRTPVRAFPLVKPNGLPAPMFPFPDQSRPGQGPTAAAQGTPQARPQPAAATPFTPQQVQQLAAAGAPYGRQQQLAALQNQAQTPLGLSASNPTLEARQQQFQALAAAQARATGQYGAAGVAAAAPGAGVQGYPYGLTPQQQQQLQAQQILAAQQQQQQHQQQQQASLPVPIAPAPSTAARTQRKPPPPAAAPAQPPPAPAPTTAAPVPAQWEDETPLTDVFDLLTPRQIASHRYATQHDLLAPVFDAWSAPAILAGLPRAREMDELVKTNGISTRLGEPRVGVVPGLGRDGALGWLGTSAARVAVFGALGKDPEKATMRLSVGERREKLEKMAREIEAQTDALGKRYEEQLGKLRAATGGEGVAAV